MRNPKCPETDRRLLERAVAAYETWVRSSECLKSTREQRVREITDLLNAYKDILEVELIAKEGSPFIKRQKGQLKLDNSVLEEFLIQLVDPRILRGLPDFALEVGPQTAFMSLAFVPASLSALGGKPAVSVKEKAQDFTVGKTIHFKFSPSPDFHGRLTTQGKLLLAVFAAEVKVNLDKTMFQEAAGTAARLKQGCPMSRYYVLAEYLDMLPEDCRLTAINNVFLLRHARRLPFGKRNVYEEINEQHQEHPVDYELVWRFVQELQQFIDAIWYDPAETISRGSFV